MQYYVASAITNASRVNEVADLFNAKGYRRTYDWTKHGSVAGAASEMQGSVALQELHGVMSAELVVLLLPGRFGTHAELGAALASSQNKRILLWSEDASVFDGGDRFCVFYHHPAVERHSGAFPDFLQYLRTAF